MIVEDISHIKSDTAGIPISSEEIQHALKIIHMKKAPGPGYVLTC